MKTNTKILIGFLAIIILSLTQTALVHMFQQDISKEAEEIKNIQAPLEVMAEKAGGYGIMLTEEVHGALLHAQEGQWEDVEEHKIVYNQIVEQEKELRRDSRILLSQSTIHLETKSKIEEQLDIIDEFNPKMIELEQKGFQAIEQKDLESANSFLIGGNHKIYKAKLVDAYRNWADIQHQLALETSEDVFIDSKQIIYLTFVFSLIISILIIITLLIIRSFVIKTQKEKKKR
jgi:hypothetical protein